MLHYIWAAKNRMPIISKELKPVSQSAVAKIRKNIAGQDEHHRKKTFAQEYEEFLAAYNFNE